jgi:ABC-type lipoprotein export system ATPase subunit
MTRLGSTADSTSALPTDHPLLIGHRVTRTYGATGRQVTAVRDASWVLARGKRVALTGPSGSGKSTLLYLMAGLDAPTSGRIRRPAWSKESTVGVVFQGASLIPSLNVVENIALPMLFAGVTESSARSRAIATAERLGIDDLANKLPQEISGGQAQRVAIARALAPKPLLILADEPTGQLNHAAADLVIDVLLQASDDAGAALVVATHDPLIARRLPHEWTMRDGRLDAGTGQAET